MQHVTASVGRDTSTLPHVARGSERQGYLYPPPRGFERPSTPVEAMRRLETETTDTYHAFGHTSLCFGAQAHPSEEHVCLHCSALPVENLAIDSRESELAPSQPGNEIVRQHLTSVEFYEGTLCVHV